MMRRSLAFSQRWRETIEHEIAARVTIHQQRIAHLAQFQHQLPTKPLVLLAHGDSWFDYPLDGNSLSFSDTDIIAQLRTAGTINPIILNISHYGDSSASQMSWPKQRRLLNALGETSNWLDGGYPDAILFSAGGDDIVGDQFCVYLNHAPSASGLNLTRLDLALDAVKASYLDLFAFRDRYAAGVPVLAHCYDFPVPDGRHPDCFGPWLKPSLDFNGWYSLGAATVIVHQALLRLRDMLVALAQDKANNFAMVDTQGFLAPEDWANELHPYPAGFKRLAIRFANTLRTIFPGRI